MVYSRPVMEALESAVARLEENWRRQSMGELVLIGASGREYSLRLYPVGSIFPDSLKAVYVFVKNCGGDSCRPLYLGQSNKAGLRLKGHENIPPPVSKDPTHIGIFEVLRDEDLPVVADDLSLAYPEAS